MGDERTDTTVSEAEPYIEALDAAIDEGNKTAAFQAVKALMDIAEAEADLAAAGTAIDSNLDKLAEIGDLQARLTRAEEALREAADDLGKAANQFASMRESQRAGHNVSIHNDPEIFEAKEAKARSYFATERGKDG